MKYSAIKFFVESILPSGHGIIQTGEQYYAFSAVQVSLGHWWPATCTQPSSSLSPQQPSAAAATMAAAAMASSTSDIGQESAYTCEH